MRARRQVISERLKVNDVFGTAYTYVIGTDTHFKSSLSINVSVFSNL